MPHKDKTIRAAHQKSRYVANREWLHDIKKGLSCARCNMPFTEHPECCDFHHVTPEDKFKRVTSLLTYSRKTLSKEIAKCIPLCANCHRIIECKY